MNTLTSPQKRSKNVLQILPASIKTICLLALSAVSFQMQAQSKNTPTTATSNSVAPTPTVPLYSKPSWWFGVAAGANFNFYNGSTQKLNSDLTLPVVFHDGKGVGLFLGPQIEYHPADSRWGIMIQAGYDNRSGKFKQVTSPCNCPTDLSAKLSYLTLEPSLRFAPFKSNLYLFAGPRLAFNIKKAFTYQLQKNPDYPEQVASPAVKADFSDVNAILLSMQFGAGYDIPLSSQDHHTQYVISPFASVQPYFGQSPRSIETWNITTVRVGLAFKFGRGHKPQDSLEFAKPKAKEELVIVPEKELNDVFIIEAPRNAPVAKKVRETFPLRNYIFFDKGNTDISKRYVLLRKDQVNSFKEEQAEGFKPNLSLGRSEKQMIVYYNILNILGVRMAKTPTATITLVGSTEAGAAQGQLMAESVKNYLVTTFAINPSRISTKGQDKPNIPSESRKGMREVNLLRDGDRRVSIETSSPTLLMEYQTGPTAPLKPVEIVQEAPLESYVAFNTSGGNEPYKSWTVAFKDKNGKVQTFGPYTEEMISIPGKTILGTKPEGDFKVTLTGITEKGETITKESNVHVVLWKAPEIEEALRYSVIFEFNQSKAVQMYQRYLTDVVAPKIPVGGTVIIRGHTDNIGEEVHNKKLSLARANEVKSILSAALAKTKRNDVKFETYGFGEDEKNSPFENKYPEERFYNRTVVIDIVPAK